MKSEELFSFDSILNILGDIIHYAENLARYEAEQKISAKVKELNESMYFANSAKFETITKELHLNKFKYERMKNKLLNLDENYRIIFQSQLDELQKRIEEYQIRRKELMRNTRQHK